MPHMMVRQETIQKAKDQLHAMGVGEAMRRLRAAEPHLHDAIARAVVDATAPLQNLGVLEDRDWSLRDAVTMAALLAVEAVRSEEGRV